jgi:uncharacterized protein
MRVADMQTLYQIGYNGFMSLHTDIKNEIKEAMIAKDALRLTVIRGLVTAFTNELVAKRRKPDEELGDEDVLAVISRQVKQRKDSIEQFEKGGRNDLAEEEKAELVILEKYLPAQMSEEEIIAFVQSKPKPELAHKNKFMGGIMKELKGKADGMLVKKAVDSLF